jgi:hypothetical protein
VHHSCPWGYVAIFILIQFQKPFCPFSLGVLKKPYNPKDTQSQKRERKKEEKRKSYIIYIIYSIEKE